MRLLLADGLVYQAGNFYRLDVAIDGPQISSLSPNIDPAGFDLIFQLNQCFISPGFADVHVHLREPGFSYKETITSGTRAAARGGYTAVCAMPNLNPVPDSIEYLQAQRAIIERDACIHVYPFAAISVGEQGRQLSDIEALAPLVCGFSDDGRGVQDRSLMREAMARIAAADSILAAHCEDDSLLHGGYIHDGNYARMHGHRGISSASEYKQVERDLELVRDTGCRYHVCHVSTKESVALLRAAKRDGLPVTCETAPHYLLLCDADLQEDGRFKMNPPIRASADRDALREGLLDDTIDVIATDHAPHSAAEKSGGLEKSLMGVVGLETAFRALHTGLVRTGVLKLEQLLDKLAATPRRIFQLGGPLAEGAAADLVVIDPDKRTTIQTDLFFSKGHSTPFDGLQTVGDSILTICGGNIVWQDKLIAN